MTVRDYYAVVICESMDAAEIEEYARDFWKAKAVDEDVISDKWAFFDEDTVIVNLYMEAKE